MKPAAIQLFLTLALVCFVSAARAANAPLAVIPITIARDKIMVPASLNGSNNLSFLLDTGFTYTMVHPDLIAPLQLRRAGEILIDGIAGEERAPTYEGAIFQLGLEKYEPRRVAALAGESNRRRRRDGILGSGLFRQYVVAIDFQRSQLTLFQPTNFFYAGAGEIVPLRFRRSSTPTVTAFINVTNGAPVRGEFQIDTGCDSGVCLGHDFIAANHLLDDAETRAGGKFGVGGGVKTRSGHLPELQLGAAKIIRPQTDFFLEGSPVDRGLAGHIGIPALRQFHVIFDYSRQRMILETSPPR